MPPMLPPDEPEHHAALNTLLAEAPRETRWAPLTRLAARLLDVPLVGVFRREGDTLACAGLHAAGADAPTPEHALTALAQALEADGPCLVADARRDARLAGLPGVTGAPGVRFVATAPLFSPSGARVGSLCLFDRACRPFGAEDQAALRDLAAAAEAALADEERTTVQAQALEAQRQRIEQLRIYVKALVSTVDAAIAGLDEKGRVFYINERMRETLGAPEGRPPELGIIPEGVKMFHLDGRPMAVEETPMFRALMGETTPGLEMRIQAPDGRLYTALANTRPLTGPAGQPHGALLVLHDVTRRDQAEEALAQNELRFQAFMDHSPALAYMKDAEGRYVYANQRFLNQAKRPREQVIGRTDFDLFPPEVAARFAENDRQAREAGTPYIEFEERVPSNEHEGTEQLFLTFKFPIKDAAGREHVGGVSVDRSERLAIERMRDDFLSLVSHELRTPLTAIKGSLSLLTSGMIGQLPEAATRLVELALSSSERLIRLSNDFLDFQRMEAGVSVLEPERCDPAEILHEAAESLRFLTDAKQMHLVIRSDAPTAWADADRVVQVLVNLLGNALKFSPAGGTVWLTAREEGDWVRFQVRDQGRGIPEDQLNAIFERFHQVTLSDAKAGGTGLGLAISRHLVHQHGGEIWASNHPEGGAVFSFILPSRAMVAVRGTVPMTDPVGGA